jgi:uroporphyrin-III C-methyltransferase
MVMNRTHGKVWLIGAGPGAPDLITLRAAAILRRADVVFYDALVHPETVALAARAEKIAVGKRCGAHSTAQRFINKRLADAACKNACVVRLKGGDPMLFGRAQEEIDALKAAGVAFEVVPGVTSALAASAALGVSLTQRGMSRNVVFVTPRSGAGESAHDWAASVLAADTAVIYMGAGQAQLIADTLIARDMSPALPVMVVESASLPQQRSYTCTLDALPDAAAYLSGGPALIMLGQVYAAAQKTAVSTAPRALSA